MSSGSGNPEADATPAKNCTDTLGQKHPTCMPATLHQGAHTCSEAGTSPATMRCARPSATAVLPTPGSPAAGEAQGVEWEFGQVGQVGFVVGPDC